MADRWLITDYAHDWLDDVLYIAIATDVPCNLDLRWTDKPEHIHGRTKERRGIAYLALPDYCFVEWHTIHQNEAGDVVNHTYTFPAWTEGVERWWTFHGTIGAVESPSDSCIFTAKYLELGSAMSLKHTELLLKEVDGVIDHADHSITPEKCTFPAATWGHIRTVEIAADVDQYTFPDDLSVYRFLRLTISNIYHREPLMTSIALTFNADAGPNYFAINHYAYDATHGAAPYNNYNYFQACAVAHNSGHHVITIANEAQPQAKHVIATSSTRRRVAPINTAICQASGYWLSPSGRIQQLTLTMGLDQFSTIVLEGIPD